MGASQTCEWGREPVSTFVVTVPRAQKKKTNALQVPLPRRLSWPCVSDLQSIYKLATRRNPR